MVSWGGTDDYEFSFVPEIKKIEETKKKVWHLLILDFLITNVI